MPFPHINSWLGNSQTNTYTIVDGRLFIKWTIGILYVMLLKVLNFIFMANFVILYYEVNLEVPIILGRPFLATGRVLVDMERNELKFRLNYKEINIDVCHSMKRGKCCFCD